MPGEKSIFNVPISTLSPAEPVCLDLGETIEDAVTSFQEHRIGCVLITEGGQLRGIFTERDLTLHVVNKGVSLTAKIDDYMTADPETLSPEDPVAFALNRMSLGGYRHVPLVDSAGMPVGIISVKDVVHYLVEHFPGEVYNLPPEPGVFGSSREGG